MKSFLALMLVAVATVSHAQFDAQTSSSMPTGKYATTVAPTNSPSLASCDNVRATESGDACECFSDSCEASEFCWGKMCQAAAYVAPTPSLSGETVVRELEFTVQIAKAVFNNLTDAEQASAGDAVAAALQQYLPVDVYAEFIEWLLAATTRRAMLVQTTTGDIIASVSIESEAANAANLTSATNDIVTQLDSDSGVATLASAITSELVAANVGIAAADVSVAKQTATVSEQKTGSGSPAAIASPLGAVLALLVGAVVAALF